MKIHIISTIGGREVQIVQGNVTSVRPLTEQIREVRLAAADGGDLPLYESGSHIRLVLSDGDTRAYSLISFDPITEPAKEYRIAVLLEPEGAGGSQYVHGLNVGDRLQFEAPKNDFPLEIDKPAVLLAGGIGITPMISMAASLKQAGQRFAFHFAARTESAMAYRDQLLERFSDNMSLHFDDDAASALDLKALVSSVSADEHLYVCGPRGMIDAAKASAEAAGIAPDRIHFELFETQTPSAGDTAFEVEIASTGQVFVVEPDKTIIETLEENDVDVMYDCQRGDCGICQCDVISGTPDHRDVVLSEAERASGKVMQICVSRAKSPRLVLDI